jgi:type VI secretion system secreted protein VgrG
VIAGPCSVESEEQIVEAARAVKAAGAKMLRGGAYKPRTSQLRLRAKDGLSLVCGDALIEMTQKAITISAPTIALAATEALTVKGKGPSLKLAEEAELLSDVVKIYSKKASLELDDNAHLNGQLVKLNCGAGDPSEATDEEGNPTTQHLSIKLTDVAFEPYAGKEFLVKAAGVKVEGTTNGDGMVEVDLPKEAETAEITLWLEPRPTGKTRRYVVTLGDLPPAVEVAGAEARLRNLGYYWGKEATEVSGELEAALRQFQEDHELPPNGKRDGATAGKLTEVHGS